MGSASSLSSVIFHSVARKAKLGDPPRKHMILQLRKKAETAVCPAAAGSFEAKVGTPAVVHSLWLGGKLGLAAASAVSRERRALTVGCQ